MICRMCLLESSNLLSIFEYECSQFQVAATIARHFWFEPTKDDPISNMICCSCWSKIEDFHAYYVSVEEVQWNLSVSLSPINSNESLQAVDRKADNAISEREAGKTELGDIIKEIEKVDVPECSFDEESTIFNDRIIDDDFSTSDDEILSNRKINAKNLKLEANSNQWNETGEIGTVSNDSTENERKRKRTRKKKTETVIQQSTVTSEYSKKSKKLDDEIAEQTKLKCDLCASEFPIFSQLQKHFRTVHKRKGYVVCCTKKFFIRGLFLDHIGHHVNPERFKCNECTKVYTTRRSLQSHMLIHHSADIKSFQCDKCPRRFAKQYLLNHHKIIHTPKDARTFFCEECGKGFTTNNALQTHRRYMHENASAQMCHICAKVIRGKTLFAKHQLQHAGITEPKQQCKECGVWLKNAFRLKQHMKKHTEADNEYICKICGKSSPSSMALQSHIQYVHSLKRQHQCNLCDKAFKKALTLREHMTTHTGDILYTCPHCPKTFNSRSNMHSHRKKVHRAEWEAARKNRGIPPELLLNNKDDDAQDNATSGENSIQDMINSVVEMCENDVAGDCNISLA